MKLLSFNNWNGLTILAVLAVIGFLCYGRVISYPFVHDDVVFIVNNPDIKSLDLIEIFHPRAVDTAVPELVNTYYRPLIELVHRIQYRLFGLTPHGYHLTNIILHILNAFMLFALFTRLKTLTKGIAFSAAVIFLVHPVQTESVACISGISNVLLLTMMLGSFHLYLDGTRKGVFWKYLLALVIFLIGCFVKEQMIVLPFVIALFEWLTDRRMKSVAGYLIPLVVYFVLRKLILGFSTTVIFDPNGEYLLRMAAIPRSILTYLSLMIFPVNLHYYRSLNVLEPSIFAAMIVAVLIGIVYWGCRRFQSPYRPYVIFGLGWMMLTIAPMLNIIPLVNEYASILNFEHFLYIPLAGMSLIVCLVAAHAAEKFKVSPSMLRNIIICVMIVGSGLTIHQNRFWRSEIALFERTLNYVDSARVRILLGKAYYFDGRHHDAIGQYQQALDQMGQYIRRATNPSLTAFYTGFIKEIYFDLAHCYEALKNWPQAVKMYRQGIEIDPTDINFYNNLAVLYIRQSEYKSAIRYLEQALVLNPQHPITRQNLAYCLVQVGQKDRADQLMQTERRNP